MLQVRIKFEILFQRLEVATDADLTPKSPLVEDVVEFQEELWACITTNGSVVDEHVAAVNKRMWAYTKQVTSPHVTDEVVRSATDALLQAVHAPRGADVLTLENAVVED